MGIELAAAFIRGRCLNAGGRCLIEEICYIIIYTKGLAKHVRMYR